MSDDAKTRKPVVVLLYRDRDGKAVSEVAPEGVQPQRGGLVSGGVVIDRQKGRHLDADTVKRRAEALAELLGCELVDDGWRCSALSAIAACGCPRCDESRKNSGGKQP